MGTNSGYRFHLGTRTPSGPVEFPHPHYGLAWSQEAGVARAKGTPKATHKPAKAHTEIARVQFDKGQCQWPAGGGPHVNLYLISRMPISYCQYELLRARSARLPCGTLNTIFGFGSPKSHPSMSAKRGVTTKSWLIEPHLKAARPLPRNGESNAPPRQ